MGFFDSLLSRIGNGPTDTCPMCAGTLDSEEHGDGSYWCASCGVLYKTVGGELVDVKDLRESEGHAGGTCEMCQASLSGGDSYLPYEDGSNSLAYMKCPSCGYKNEREGFGE